MNRPTYILLIMDLAAFRRSDLATRTRIKSIEAMRYNKRPNVVTIVAFVGNSDGRQKVPLSKAILRLQKEYFDRKIHIVYDELTNDMVKSLGWTPTTTIDAMLTGDMHLDSTHMNQGNMNGVRKEWNMWNINSNLDRLELHPGVPSGKKIYDVTFRQDKFQGYEEYQRLGLCAPTIGVDLTDDVHVNSATRVIIER